MKHLSKIFIIFTAALLSAAVANAQGVNNIRRATDSVVSTFGKAVDGCQYHRTELIESPTNYYIDELNDLTGDTIWVENFEDFKFYRKRTDGHYTVAEYYEGKNATLFEAEKVKYYYDDGHLVMTDYMFVRHGEAIEDFGVSMFVEQKRMLFEANGERLKVPLMLFREVEEYSANLNMDAIPFRQIDVTRIMYDKNIYELLANKIYND